MAVSPNQIVRRYTTQSKWSEIAKQIRSGNYGFLSLNDEIHFTMKDGKEVGVRVVALNPYEENTVAFSFIDCIGSGVMNDRDTNRGGWAQCKARQYINNELLALLPDDLVEVIRPRSIVQVIDGTKYESGGDKLWLPSRTELFGAHGSYKDIDFGDIQFDGLKTFRDRMKMLNGEPHYPWMRSPSYGSSHSFCLVDRNGGSFWYYASYSYAFAPAFII